MAREQRSHFHRRQPTTGQRGNQINTTGCGRSTEQIIPTADKSNRKQAAMMQTIFGLHGNTPRCKNPTLCIRHDPQRALRCLVSLQPKRTQQSSRHFFLGSLPQQNKSILLNVTIHVLCTILRFVAASAAEAKLGALFLNAKESKIMRRTLKELGHPQPPTPSTSTTQQQWES
eukprot:CCRYP_010322-RA/>CCRYP_010322-RA protein AED:0.44 eAED:0.45 QI:0/-1/0/1/-1/1/1/0/172